MGRTDLLINVNGDEQVVEAKVYQNITQFGDGKVQLAYYVKRMGLKTGYYLVFVDTEVTHTGVAEADYIGFNLNTINHFIPNVNGTSPTHPPNHANWLTLTLLKICMRCLNLPR